MFSLRKYFFALEEKKFLLAGFLSFLPFLILGIWKEKLWLMSIPIILYSSILIIYHYKILYWLLIGSIPLSITLDFNSHLSTDFPTEFLAIGLTAIFWIHFLYQKPKNAATIWNHPIFWGLCLIWFWAILSALLAEDKTIAIKYVLAKIWYITSYFIFTYYILKNKRDLKSLFWAIYIPLFITVIYSFTNTALGNFNFENTNKFSLPFYDNHVIYATIMTLALPFVYHARYWYKKGSIVRLFLGISIPFLLIAIYFSYTRACYLAIVIGLGILIILKLKKMIVTYILCILLTLGTLFYFAYDYTYLRLAPDYNTTVMHNEFKDHLISTFYGKDASSMERLNMWVGVFRMYQEHPIVGFGPNNFSKSYKPYTVMYFKTWVSDNPLNLSCHNYFWLLLAEQGIVGVALFILFLGIVFYQLQKSFASSKDLETKKAIQAVTVSITSFVVILFFNDLIENSKVGSLFFILLAILIRIEEFSKKNQQ